MERGLRIDYNFAVCRVVRQWYSRKGGYTVTDAQLFNFRAYRLNNAGSVVLNLCRKYWFFKGRGFSPNEIWPAQTQSLYPDRNFATRRFRPPNFLDLQHFRSARFVETNYSGSLIHERLRLNSVVV